MFDSAHVQQLRKKHNALRKNGGPEHSNFLYRDFEFPSVATSTQRVVPSPVSRVGDEDTLRVQNLSLNQELSEAQKQITIVENRLKAMTRDRDAKKRKAERCETTRESLRKKQKAATEKSKYWQKEVHVL